jgi:hypothetical protein
MASENKVLRITFGPQGEIVLEDRKIRKEERRNLYFSVYFIRMINSRMIYLSWYVQIRTT